MKKNQKKIILVGFVASAILQGCVSSSGTASTVAVDDWQLSGKVAAVYPKTNCMKDNCSPHSDQGKIKWQQRGEEYDITVFDPFGRVVIELDGNSRMLSAVSPGQKTINTTPENFLTLLVNKKEQNKALSTLNPNDLRYWVTGRASPNAGKVTHHQDGKRFEQKGYTITTKQWRATPVGQLPSLVNIVKGKFKLRLVIRNWQKVD